MANENTNMEETLAKQIGGIGGSTVDEELEESVAKIPTEEELAAKMQKEGQQKADDRPQQGMVGQKLQFYGKMGMSQDERNELADEKNLSRIGDKIGAKAEYREGWIDVDRALLGERSMFYPEDWQFKIKPATVEAIRNWSTIDEKSANSIDVVFDEVLKSCLAIQTNKGPQPWSQINAWDRFFFILLIREYTFQTGESKITFKRECPNCEAEIDFELNSQALMYDMPDEDVMKNYDAENRQWIIYPQEYEIPYDQEQIILYLPTREKDANIRNWLVDRLQADQNAKIDRVFMKFLPWMCPKISKDAAIAKNQIRKAETEFRSWDVDMFEFMDSVIRNISVTPSQDMLTVCPSCGEEATAPIQFPDGISSLFHTNSPRKKFGKK